MAKVRKSGGAPKQGSDVKRTASAPAVAKARKKAVPMTYNAVVYRSAKSGMFIAEPTKADRNPYLLPREKALKVAKKAGIITPSGKLSTRFK
jgi:hypothetical protein